MDKQQIREWVKEQGIQVIRLFFTDVLGKLKGLNIAVSEIDRALDDGIAFDGSSVEGFVRIEESDLVVRPDLSTFRRFPFNTGGVTSAFFICDVTKPDGTPLESDPRHVLARALACASAEGFDSMCVGPELEYFYFPNDRDPTPMDTGGYFDIMPLDKSSAARKATLSMLTSMGIAMEASHHEVSTGQHEIDFRYGDAMSMADNIMVSKIVVKEVAREHGLYASFMPKPIAGVNGSGMHVHQSLFSKGVNTFFDPADPYRLSPVAKKYVAGLLRHAREMTAVTNQWVNSYKRLVPGYEAPVYICWARRNRSTLVRVPAFKEGKASSCRVEYRAPDPGANPYLAFAVMLTAGLTGIRNDYPLADAVEKDIYSMTSEERRSHAIDWLPGDLLSATQLTESSKVVREALGDELFAKFLANKHEEWDRYRLQVTDYELKTYLPVL
jgi:glutamine synthetase